MRSSREEQETPGRLGKLLSQCITEGLFYLIPVFISRELVGLVHDHQIPLDLFQGLLHIVLPGKVQGGDELVSLLPDVLSPTGIDHGPVNHSEIFLKLLFHFSKPLIFKMAWNHNKDPVHQTPVFKLFDQESCHDGLACSRIIGQEESDPGIAEDVVINGFYLVGKGIHLGNAHGEEGIELIGVSDAVGLYR